MKLSIEQLSALAARVRVRIVPEARDYIEYLKPLLNEEGLTKAQELGARNARLVNAAIANAIEELP